MRALLLQELKSGCANDLNVNRVGRSGGGDGVQDGAVAKGSGWGWGSGEMKGEGFPVNVGIVFLEP